MIETLPTGIRVIASDSHLGKWIKDAGGVLGRGGDSALEAALSVLKPGDFVVDVGCNIGIHSRFFMEAVGDDGCVIGFDPNYEAIMCAQHNCRDGLFITAALGSSNRRASLVVQENVGASYLTDGCDVDVITLDSFYAFKRLDFIKIDAEGCETEVLTGARVTIERFRPVMVIEVNEAALHRQGATPQSLLTQIEGFGYSWEIVPHGLKPTEPQFDVLCRPNAHQKS